MRFQTPPTLFHALKWLPCSPDATFTDLFERKVCFPKIHCRKRTKLSKPHLAMNAVSRSSPELQSQRQRRSRQGRNIRSRAIHSTKNFQWIPPVQLQSQSSGCRITSKRLNSSPIASWGPEAPVDIRVTYTTPGKPGSKLTFISTPTSSLRARNQKRLVIIKKRPDIRATSSATTLLERRSNGGRTRTRRRGLRYRVRAACPFLPHPSADFLVAVHVGS